VTPALPAGTWIEEGRDNKPAEILGGLLSCPSPIHAARSAVTGVALSVRTQPD